MINKDLVYQYWEKKDTLKLKASNNLQLLNLETHELLFEIGLPTIGNLKNPIKKIEKIKIDNQEHIKLIRILPLEMTKNEDDALILLNVENNQIFYFNNFLYERKMIDSPYSYMNKDLLSMFYFWMIFDEFEKKITVDKLKALTIKDAKNLYSELLKKMNFVDYYAVNGLDLNPNKATFWYRQLSNPRFDLEEFYNESFATKR